MIAALRTPLRGALLAWVLGLAAVMAQPSSSLATDRASTAAEALGLVERERDALRADMRDRQQACQQRLFVSPCLRDVETQERQALAALRAREVRIEESERVRLRDAALQRSLQAQNERAQRPPVTSDDPQGAEVVRRAQAQTDREAHALARVQRQQERQQELENRRRSLDEEARSRARPARVPPPEPATP